MLAHSIKSNNPAKNFFSQRALTALTCHNMLWKRGSRRKHPKHDLHVNNKPGDKCGYELSMGRLLISVITAKTHNFVVTHKHHSVQNDEEQEVKQTIFFLIPGLHKLSGVT